MYTFPPLPDTSRVSLSLEPPPLLDLDLSSILSNTITRLVSLCVILVSPSLESSVGLVTIGRSTRLSSNRIVLRPLLRDNTTYALKGLSVPLGTFPRSTTTYSVVWPWER